MVSYLKYSDIAEIDYIDSKKIKVYDLTVEDNHNYFLNVNDKKILVHNSGKTYLDCRILITRACKYPNTRHLICRANRRSCIESVWNQTLLPQLEENEGLKGAWHEDKTYRVIHFSNGSEIHAGGFDNKIYTDTVLSKEYATILIVEISELSFQIFNKLKTRLNWNPSLSDIKLLMILETNPTRASHWSNKYFHRHVDPETREKLLDNETKRLVSLWFSPEDNKTNISHDYLESLRNLKGKARKRFYEGLYDTDTTGLVYEFDRSINCVDEPIVHKPQYDCWRTWDFGISPSYTFIIWYQIAYVPVSKQFPMGILIEIYDEYMAQNKDYKHYADIVWGKDYDNHSMRDAGDPAGSARNESLTSWASKLSECGIYIIEPSGFNSCSDYIAHANAYMHAVRVNEKQCPHTVEFFEMWSYPKDDDGNIKDNKPLHDEYSHGGTSWYYGMGATFPYEQSGMEV